MDRQTLERHLALAEGHVLEGERHLASQRRILADLERDGHKTTKARQLLAMLEETQKMHVEDRDRLTRELDRLGPPPRQS